MAIKKFKVEASKEAKTDGKAKKPVKTMANTKAKPAKKLVKASSTAKRRAKAVKASSDRSWVNTDLTKEEWAKLRTYLKEKGYKYEPSSNGDEVHVECYLNADEIREVDAFIDTLDAVASACGKKSVKSSKRLVKASSAAKRRSKKSVKASIDADWDTDAKLMQAVQDYIVDNYGIGAALYVTHVDYINENDFAVDCFMDDQQVVSEFYFYVSEHDADLEKLLYSRDMAGIDGNDFEIQFYKYQRQISAPQVTIDKYAGDFNKEAYNRLTELVKKFEKDCINTYTEINENIGDFLAQLDTDVTSSTKRRGKKSVKAAATNKTYYQITDDKLNVIDVADTQAEAERLAKKYLKDNNDEEYDIWYVDENADSDSDDVYITTITASTNESQTNLQSYGNSIKSEIQSIANKSGYTAPYSPSVGNTDIFFDGHYENVPVVVFELNEQYGKNADAKKLARTLKKFFKGTGYDCFVQDTTKKPLGTKDLVIYKSSANDASVKASRRITASTDDDTIVMYWDGNKVFEGDVNGNMWREITWFLDEPEHMQDIVDYCNSFGDPLITDTSTSLENIRDIAKTFVDLVAMEIDEAEAVGDDVYVSDEAGHFEIFKKSRETSNPWEDDVTASLSNKNRTDYKSNPIYELNDYVKKLAEGVVANIDGISYEISDEAISFFITNGDVVFVQPIEDITPEPDDLPSDTDELTSAVLAELDNFDEAWDAEFNAHYADDPDFATRAVQMSTTEDELEPVMGDEPMDLGYGFDSNGEAIDESTVEALYHMAEYEILPNTELGQIDQYVSIDEDSWDYYFGGFTNTGMLGVVKFYIHFHLTDDTINLNEYALPEASMFPDFQYYTAKLDFDIYTENGEVTDVIFEGAEIREVKDNVYSKQYSEGFDKYYNVEAIKNYIENIAKSSVEEIYAAVVNM